MKDAWRGIGKKHPNNVHVLTRQSEAREPILGILNHPDRIAMNDDALLADKYLNKSNKKLSTGYQKRVLVLRSIMFSNGTEHFF